MGDKRSFFFLLLLIVSFVFVPVLRIETAKAEPETILAFLEEVVLLDLTKYHVELNGDTVTELTYTTEEVGKYTLESEQSTMTVLFNFRNTTLSWILINLDGSPIYTQSPSNDTLKMVYNFLCRYQDFFGDSEAAHIIDALNGFDELQNVTTTVGNYTFSLSGTSNGDATLFWKYNYYGLVYPILVQFTFENGFLRSIIDQRIFKVGDPTLNVSEEEAVELALEKAQVIALDASDHEWTAFEIPEDKINTELCTGIRDDYFTYSPYWSVSLPQYNPYFGHIGTITVTVWADNGLVSVTTTSVGVSETSYSGVLSIDEYAWTSLTPMPTARSGLGVAVVDGKIYAIGGYNGSYLAVNEMYDPETDTWTTKASMPTARKDFAVAVYQNKIYVFGGNIGYIDSETSGYSGVTEVYDTVTDTWETKTSMPTPRSNLCASVVDDKIFLMGGAQYRSGLFDYYLEMCVNEVYDPATDTWETKTSMPKGAWDYLSAVIDSKIYFFGGQQAVLYRPGSTSFSNTQVYDVETDTWSTGKAIPLYVYHGASGATTGVLFPKGILVLGRSITGSGTVTTQLYIPENDTWIIGSQMITSRTAFAVAVINDEIYAIGGTSDGNVLAVNERYVPVGYIPEFPSWAILPLLVVGALVVVFFKKRLPLQKVNG